MRSLIDFATRGFTPPNPVLASRWVWPARGIALTAILIFAALCPTLATAQSSSQPGPVGSMFQKMNPMNWKMPAMKAPSFRLPNFMVQQNDQERIVERKNTLVTDVKSTASRSWQRTKETLNPARLNPMNLFAGPSTNAPPPRNDSSPGFFKSMFTSPPEPEERVANVNDFLNQQRPK